MRFFKKIWRPVVAIVFLTLLIKAGPIKIEQIRLVLGQPRLLGLGIFLFFFQFVLFAFRWKIFVDQIAPNQIEPIRPFIAFKLTLLGQFFSFFVPGGVGGDLVKALELSKDHKMTKSQALSSVIADRVLGLFSMILLATIFLSLEYFQTPSEQIAKYTLLSWALFLTLSFGLFSFPICVQIIVSSNWFKTLFNSSKSGTSRISKTIDKLFGSLELSFRSFRNPKLMIKTISLCLILQLITIYFMFVVVKSVGAQPPPFFVFFSLCCFGILASAIPLTPAGIGVGQAAFFLLFDGFGRQMAEASVTAISVLQLFLLFFSLFGGLFFAMKAHPVNQLNDERSKRRAL